jgi:RecB family exonuclease
MKKAQLTEEQRALEVERGTRALRAYLAVRGTSFRPGDRAEHNFRNEGVFVGDAHLSGKIDKLEIDHTNRTIVVADYKTGKSHSRWTREASLHKYRLQLYMYKFLVEGSRSFKGYRVVGAYLDFVEPDQEGNMHQLHLAFDDAEYDRVKKLVAAMWRHITTLDLPDTSDYTADMNGIEAFENDLLSE